MKMSIDLIIILKKIFKEEILQEEDHFLITEVDHLLIIEVDHLLITEVDHLLITEVDHLLTIEVNQEILTQLLTATTNNKIREREI
jgi:hypothetical protein